LRLQISC